MNEKGIWKEKRKGVDDYLYALKKKEESEKQRKAGTGLLSWCRLRKLKNNTADG